MPRSWFDENAPTDGSYTPPEAGGFTGGRRPGAGGGTGVTPQAGAPPPAVDPNAPFTGTFTGGGQYPLASVMGSGLLQPWTTPFTAPNDVTQQTAPGFQFRLNQGLQAIERSASAKGTLLTGGTIKDLTKWAQEYSSGEFDKVYSRAKSEYGTAYDIWSNNQNNQYARLNQLATGGANAAARAAQTASGYGSDMAGLTTDQANAEAAASVARGNNVGGLVSGLGTLGASTYLSAATAPKKVNTTSSYVPPPATPVPAAPWYPPASKPLSSMYKVRF